MRKQKEGEVIDNYEDIKQYLPENFDEIISNFLDSDGPKRLRAKIANKKHYQKSMDEIKSSLEFGLMKVPKKYKKDIFEQLDRIESWGVTIDLSTNSIKRELKHEENMSEDTLKEYLDSQYKTEHYRNKRTALGWFYKKSLNGYLKNLEEKELINEEEAKTMSKRDSTQRSELLKLYSYWFCSSSECDSIDYILHKLGQARKLFYSKRNPKNTEKDKEFDDIFEKYFRIYIKGNKNFDLGQENEYLDHSTWDNSLPYTKQQVRELMSKIAFS